MHGGAAMMTKPLLYLLGALLLASAFTNWTTHTRLQAARLELAQERLAHQTLLKTHAEQRTQAESKAREAERAHAQTIEVLTQKAAHDRKTLAADVARLTRSLRDRPERPASGVPTSAASGMACTGAQLYRADGEFLAGEAARANETRLQLADCRARYDAAVTLTQGD